MSQADFIISNQIFPLTRAEISASLQALASSNSGATEPVTTYAHQLWYDTATDFLKMRNAANDGWYTLGYFDVGTGFWELRSNIWQASSVSGITIKNAAGSILLSISDSGVIAGFAASGSKATPLEADGVVIVDTAASNIIKRVTWANIKATLKTYFDTLYAVYATTTTNGPVELATTAEGETGTDTARVPAVDVVKAMVTTHTPPTIAGMSYGDIGSYIFGIVETTGFTGGVIFAGADIRPAALGAVLTTLADDTRSAGTASALWSGSGALSGTWQAMGGSEADGASQRTRATLFLRVT